MVLLGVPVRLHTAVAWISGFFGGASTVARSATHRRAGPGLLSPGR